jgi:hypothetical protein
MIARTRQSATAIEYIQHANAMISIPANIVAAILLPCVSDTDAP